MSSSSSTAIPSSLTTDDVRVASSQDALASELASFIAQESAAAIKERGVFHVALSGGSLPATLGQALKSGKFDLTNWHWWFADERCVKLDDKESNFLLCKQHVFDPLGVKVEGGKVHHIDANVAEKPEEAAVAYEKTLRTVVPSGVLDLLLLGMGPDGHCCSLFPGHPLLKERSKWIAPIEDSPKPPPKRITITYDVIDKARCSLFVLAGSNKADATHSILTQRATYAQTKDDSTFLPSARVRSQRVVFLLDQEAAEKLPKELKVAQQKL